ncbi:MAG TPA: decaprenyl-phosphate phosphoribosyltransferase [Solirubrobacteraceae bacterium]|jgi:decaprenyl-phosphate phosphoribosyltransferase|nr:decaprenyl-phosphate phosphoribosyltransferase [Solirubrobacteraceae bacterium]
MRALPAPERRRGVATAALVTMRPRQWIKNSLVVAAPAAAGALGHDDVPGRVGLAFVAFSLLASGIYAVNDVRDAAEDRRHPRKRRRPVAAGELTPTLALSLGVALMIVGLSCCAFVAPALALVGAAYLAVTLTYTTVWRRVVIADIAAIAAGFVLRAIAGGVAAPVALSHWFILVVVFSAVFVAAGKRHAELRRAPGGQLGRRAVLHLYTESRLRVALTASMALAFAAYLLWAVAGPLVEGVPWRLTTVIPFAGCLLRYGMLLRRGDGEAPEDLVFGDRWLRFWALAWIVTFAITIHATH